MVITLDPPFRAGLFRIGMPFEQVGAMFDEMPGRVMSARDTPGFADFESGLSVSIGSDTDHSVRSIEIFRPDGDCSVVYRGIEVFRTDASQVIELLSEMTETVVDDDGLGLVAPGLLLAFRRYSLPEGPDDEDGRYFESVLLAAPGYYD